MGAITRVVVRTSTDVAVARWRTVAVDVVALHEGISLDGFAFRPGGLRSGSPCGSRSGTARASSARAREVVRRVHFLVFMDGFLFLLGFLFLYIRRENTTTGIIVIQSAELNRGVPIAHKSRAIKD
jgi:hypothetical protein